MRTKEDRKADANLSDKIEETIGHLREANRLLLRPPDMDRGEFFPKVRHETPPAGDRRLICTHLQNAKEALGLAIGAANDLLPKEGV